MIALFSCPQRRRRGFTMTELMVVIGVIAVLAGILLAAMRGVRGKAMQTRTESTMRQFAQAAESFQLEHNRYPGAIPEGVLNNTGGAIPVISGTENALLELMGGSCLLLYPAINSVDPECDEFADGFPTTLRTIGAYQLKIARDLIGNGPVINRAPYSPYFSATDRELAVTRGQLPNQQAVDEIPDLIDAWGQPIIYLRRARTSGPLVGAFSGSPAGTAPPQFYRESMFPYLQSTQLGAAGLDQTNENGGSILNVADDPDATLAQILRHPGLGDYGDAVANLSSSSPRGSFCLLSAGPDGVYYSVKDGPGSDTDPVSDIVQNPDDPDYNNPKVVDDYDDIRVFGGG